MILLSLIRQKSCSMHQNRNNVAILGRVILVSFNLLVRFCQGQRGNPYVEDVKVFATLLFISDGD